MHCSCELGIIFGRLLFINVVCDILKSICGLYKYRFCLSHKKAKKRKRRGLPRVPRQRHSGKRIFFKKRNFSLSVWSAALGEEDLKNEILPRVSHQ
jgi:hypothetical protein